MKISGFSGIEMRSKVNYQIIGFISCSESSQFKYIQNSSSLTTRFKIDKLAHEKRYLSYRRPAKDSGVVSLAFAGRRHVVETFRGLQRKKENQKTNAQGSVLAHLKKNEPENH